MLSPSRNPTLPVELDFAANPAASPARMNEAMSYIVASLRRIESVQPDFLRAIDQLRGIGLDRLNEVLNPLFVDAQAIAAELEAIRTAVIEGDTLAAFLAQTDAALDEIAADVAAASAALMLAPTQADIAFTTGSF